MDDFKASPHYRKIYGKGSLNNWADGIGILYDWKIIDEETRKQFFRLKQLRDESVHYRKKDQDPEQMSLEAIGIVNVLVKTLFGLGPERKDILIYFEVPGELFIKRVRRAILWSKRSISHAQFWSVQNTKLRWLMVTNLLCRTLTFTKAKR